MECTYIHTYGGVDVDETHPLLPVSLEYNV